MKPVKTGTVHPVPSAAKQSGWRDLFYSKKRRPICLQRHSFYPFSYFFYTPSLVSSS
ncbi:L-arabinose transport system permease protein AraP [Bacillus subtilis]|nr:L-arabinose transport system permease protein AraP [Bacillus subtilis]